MKKGLNTIVAVVLSAILLITTTGSAVNAVTILTGDDVIVIEDTYFLNALISRGTDLNKDGKISVKEMESLNYLYIYDYNRQITDVSALSYAKNIINLDLSYAKVSNLSFTKNMTKLESLYIYNEANDINNTIDISVLGGLKQLKSLSLNNCLISDISILKGLTNLTQLYLGSNNISDISSLKDLINLRSLILSNNKITDISSLSGLVNLSNLQIENNQITNISYLKNLKDLNSLMLYNNNIKDADIFALARLSTETMFKGRQYNGALYPYGILSNFTLTTDNKDIILIENNYITALKEGEATIKLQSGALSKSFNVKVNGIVASQPLETSTIITTELYRGAALNSKGELWNLADNGTNIVMSNVKKYVANAVYEGEPESRSDLSNKLAIDSNNTLWSWGADLQNGNGTMSFQNKKEELKNVQYVDSRYAVTKTNELWDYTIDSGKLLDNVKQIKRIKSNPYSTNSGEYNIGTEVLKTDGTLWVRRDVKFGATTKAFVNVATNIRELTDSNGYIGNNGVYYQWDGAKTGNLVFKNIASGVSSVKSGFIVKTDNTVISPYSNLKIPGVIGLKEVKQYGYASESYGSSYLVDNNNVLYRYNGSQATVISAGFKEFTESGFKKSDGYIYDFNNIKIDYIAKLDYYINELTLGADNILYMSGVKILTNVKKIYQSTGYPTSYYAVRSDGSIWEVGDRLPTKILNINYDVDHNGRIDISDLANIGLKYNAISTSTKYNKECDFNKDNIIDIYDIVSFSKKLRNEIYYN